EGHGWGFKRKPRARAPTSTAASKAPDMLEAVSALIVECGEDAKKAFPERYPAFSPKPTPPKASSQLYIELFQSQSVAERKLSASTAAVQKNSCTVDGEEGETRGGRPRASQGSP
ncbi:MAG: hypothetical protein ACKPKO_44305, partial [Candidatus Fonsibacter sp.]